MIPVQGGEGLLQIIYMIPRGAALDQHIIYVDFYVMTNLVFKDFIHQLLIDHSYILQIKRHHFVIEQTTVNNKSYLFHPRVPCGFSLS